MKWFRLFRNLEFDTLLQLWMIMLVLAFSGLIFCDYFASVNSAQDCSFHQCRLWGIIADSLPKTVVIDHLVDAPYSLKNLGASNYNGWGLAYYNESKPIVMRGALPANIDYNFTVAVQELATSSAHIGIGHVRRATSGATSIPNPHPFIRYKGGKWWAFGHNGHLSKLTLKNLLGTEYLEENPPTVGVSWDDPDVIDSDLYMLYILKCIEENGWNATLGIAKAVFDISQLDYGAMNFILSDGETLWGFCKGNTLYYYYSNDPSPQYAALASQPPNASQNCWIALNDFNLIILSLNNPPIIIEDTRVIPEFSTNLILTFLMLTKLTIIVLQRKGHSIIRFYL